MKNEAYVRIDWPESQVIMDWKEEYQDQTILIDDAGYMVPVEVWSKYQTNPEQVCRIETD